MQRVTISPLFEKFPFRGWLTRWTQYAAVYFDADAGYQLNEYNARFAGLLRPISN